MKLNQQNIERAIELAKEASPKIKVHVETFGMYKAFSPSSFNTYVVRFWKVGNEKHASCNCKAITVCKHIGASIGRHIQLASEQTNVIQISDYRRAA